ncbi:MAG: TlpA disulfide reductase family protein [Bacteroidales bacterium]
MRTNIFLFLLLLFFSCTPNYNYRIEGTVKDNSLDGMFIYLQEIRDNRLVTIDSSLVKNAHFIFKGSQESPVIRELSFRHHKQDGLSSLVFILQPGEMKAYIDSVSYVTGTEQNNRLHQYFEKLHYYQTRISGLITQYQIVTLSNELTDSLQIAFQGWYDSIHDDLTQLSYDFILENNNSVAGGLVFLQSYPYLSVNQIETVLNTAGPDFRSIHGVDIVEEQIKREKKVALGNLYIDFSMSDQEGNTVTLDSLVGHDKWVLLDFWASWCLPCDKEIPFLKEIYAEFKPKGLEIVSVSLDSDHDSWLQAIKKYKMPWLQLSDLKGWECEAALIYGIHAVPYTILIDPDGRIVAKGIRHQALQKELKKIFL